MPQQHLKVTKPIRRRFSLHNSPALPSAAQTFSKRSSPAARTNARFDTRSISTTKRAPGRHCISHFLLLLQIPERAARAVCHSTSPGLALHPRRKLGAHSFKTRLCPDPSSSSALSRLHLCSPLLAKLASRTHSGSAAHVITLIPCPCTLLMIIIILRGLVLSLVYNML